MKFKQHLEICSLVIHHGIGETMVRNQVPVTYIEVLNISSDFAFTADMLNTSHKLLHMWANS